MYINSETTYRKLYSQTSNIPNHDFQFSILSNNAYSSKCEDPYDIELLEKFSLCLSEIIQSFYYAILSKTVMLHSTVRALALLATCSL